MESVKENASKNFTFHFSAEYSDSTALKLGFFDERVTNEN